MKEKLKYEEGREGRQDWEGRKEPDGKIKRNTEGKKGSKRSNKRAGQDK